MSPYRTPAPVPPRGPDGTCLGDRVALWALVLFGAARVAYVLAAGRPWDGVTSILALVSWFAGRELFSIASNRRT